MLLFSSDIEELDDPAFVSRAAEVKQLQLKCNLGVIESMVSFDFVLCVGQRKSLWGCWCIDLPKLLTLSAATAIFIYFAMYYFKPALDCSWHILPLKHNIMLAVEI